MTNDSEDLILSPSRIELCATYDSVP